ncbi:MAG TPA: RNA 2',3'-cyclic phosphodiesterase, partial [Actinomycetota bacterium]|nr:RNA 2',3'-cyclic phosphodiesterase [Actinomycetota bacterium]
MGRLFVAVDLPGAVKDAVADVVERARDQAPAARWVARSNMHITLSFLGAVEDARVPQVASTLAGSVAGLVDFPVTLDGIGAFPSAS